MNVHNDFWKTSISKIVNNIEPVTKNWVFSYNTGKNNLKIQFSGKSASRLVKSGNLVENTYLFFNQNILSKPSEVL